MYQTYDNLINYKRESCYEFVPMLATEVPSVENGLIKDDGLTYIFPIRKDVKFRKGILFSTFFRGSERTLRDEGRVGEN